MSTPTYNPQVSPNVIMNFVVTPYNPPTSPNVTMNFGSTTSGGSGGGHGLVSSNFFLVM